jgi:phage terminase large subunit-like protein
VKIDLSNVPPELREEAEQLAQELASAAQANPLVLFHPHCDEQARFLAAKTPTVAAFCGNQSGKSTIGAVKALVQLLPGGWVPEQLAPYKLFNGPVHGWAECPTEDKIFDSLVPALQKWCPPQALKGGNWAKAFNGGRMLLTFANGSTLGFKTYKQDPSTLGGATLHFVWYDEPPPRAHRDESVTRLLAHNGPEFYTMTPLKANTGWIRRDIWRKREHADFTVCKWGMRDNPYLSKDAIPRILASYKNDIWRQAREFGDFMDVAGLVYGDIERCVVPLPTQERHRELVHSLDHIWGIDPGIRNAAIVCGGFDSHGVDWIYDEALIQNGTPTQYAQRIDVLLARHGLTRRQVIFVIDPAARQRSQATGDTVQNELARVGIYTANGNNDREAGQQQIRDRILHRRIQVFENCRGIRDDADEFAWEMDDGDDDDIGPADDSPFHRLATLRYQVMMRPYYPQREKTQLEKGLGRLPDQALDLRYLSPQRAAHPMGGMA